MSLTLQGESLLEKLREQLRGVMPGSGDEVLVRCQLAKELEAAGDFEGAREALGDLWRGVGERPAVEGLGRRETAEALLWAGALTGRIGKGKGIEGAQEKAIDLMSESARIFEELCIPDKVGECWSHIGLCYLQQAAYDEGRVALETALSRFQEREGEGRALAVIRSAHVENTAGKHFEAFRILQREGDWLSSHNSHYIRGQFHIAFGDVHNYLSADEEQARRILGVSGEPSFADRTLLHYAAAGFHFEEVGHLRHAGRVRNNTGYLLFTLGRFEEAHENLDRAREIFRRLDEWGSVGQVDDTRARVLIAQGNNPEAEQVSRDAVQALERGDDSALVAQALTTNGQALARLGRYNDARNVLEQAVETAIACRDNDGAGQACLAIIEELADVLPAYDVWGRYEQADQLLAEAQRPETVSRLRACARITLAVGRRALRTDLEDGWTGCDLEEEVERYEAELIRQAMAAENGRITRAALRLNTSHQNLRNIINGRQRERLGAQYAARQRKSNNTVHGATATGNGH